MTAAFPLASPLSHHRPPARLLISFYRRDSSAELSTGVAVSGRPGSGDGHAAPRPPEKPTRRYLIIDDSRGWASRDSASDAAVFPPSSLHSARRLPARSLARLESMSAASSLVWPPGFLFFLPAWLNDRARVALSLVLVDNYFYIHNAITCASRYSAVRRSSLCLCTGALGRVRAVEVMRDVFRPDFIPDDAAYRQRINLYELRTVFYNLKTRIPHTDINHVK